MLARKSTVRAWYLVFLSTPNSTYDKIYDKTFRSIIVTVVNRFGNEGGGVEIHPPIKR